MGGVVKRIVNPIVRVVKKVVSFAGDFFGFNIKPMGAPDVGGAEQEQGVLLNRTGTNEQIPVVYGFRRVGGTVIFVETNGTSNTYLYVCYVVCEGEIAGFKRILVDDTILPTPPSGIYDVNTIIDVTEGKYAGRCQFQVFNGTESQSQSSLLNQTPSWPTKTRKLPGVAYVAMRFEWKAATTQAEADANPYGGGVPTVQFDVCGKKLYDVTTHTSGAQLSNTYANLTKTYTGSEGTNPANCLLDYMMNSRYGCGISRDEIDADSFKIAANKYNQSVTYYKEGLTLYPGAAMTCCAVLDTRQKLIDNVKILVGGARGMLPYVQGRYKLIVEDGGHPTDITSATVTIAYDVDKSEIVGGITLTGETKTTKYNQVIVNYVDPNTDFTVQQAVYRVSGDLTVDQDEELTGEFTFGTISNAYIAKFMAESIYKKSRNQLGIEFTATQELMDVVPGDIIRVTDDILNLSNKTFRVVNMKLNVDGTISMSCTEHIATNYPYVPGPQIDIPPPVYLPGPTEPTPPVSSPPIAVPPSPSDPLPGTPPPVPAITSWLWWATTQTFWRNIYEEQPSGPITQYKKYATVPEYATYVGAFYRNPTPNIPGESGAISQVITGSIFTFHTKRPADAAIYKIKIEAFKDNQLKETFSFLLPNIISTTNTAGGVNCDIVLNKLYEYRVRYVKKISQGEQDVEIGGTLLWVNNFQGYSYSLAGTNKTSTSIEALINYVKNTDTQLYGAANIGLGG
jgi:hypothetical protein